MKADARRASWGVFLAALILRAAYAWTQGLPAVVGDAREYHGYAKNLVELGRYVGPDGDFATRMPGYPLFLAAVRVLSGGSIAAAVAAQCLLGALTCVFLLKLARRLLPEPWALACGLFGAAYYGLIAPCAYLYSECVFSFFLTASAWALYNADWTPGRRALAFGALSGYLYLVRPEPLPYILATCVFLPRLFPRFGRREVAKSLAAAALVAGLWVGRNALLFRRFIPASTVGRNVAYLALFLPAEQQGLAPEGRYGAPASLNELDRDAEMGRAYRELAGRLTLAQRAKARLYNLLSILYPFLPAYDWTYGVLAPFFLLGLGLAARRKELRPMAGAVTVSFATFMFFGGPASRYRQGVSPFILLLAAAGLESAARAAGSSRFRAGAGIWAGANLAVWAFSAQVREFALLLKSCAWPR